jgi:hypothetical protein
MRLLKTEDQQDLQNLLQGIKDDPGVTNLELGLKNDLDFWLLELKPKRVRKKVLDNAVNI